MFKNAKVSEKVYHKNFGEGIITRLGKETDKYPIIVKFYDWCASFTADGCAYFTADGKDLCDDKEQSLFYLNTDNSSTYNLPYFEDAKVGENVYTKKYGEGKIISIIDNDDDWPITVKYNKLSFTQSFTADGKDFYGVEQELFYSNMKEEVQEVQEACEEPEIIKKYIVLVEEGKEHSCIYESYENAVNEAKRLSSNNRERKVHVLEIVESFKSTLVVESIK